MSQNPHNTLFKCVTQLPSSTDSTTPSLFPSTDNTTPSLFPSTDSTTPSLFPSTSNCPQPTSEPPGLSWLQNSSFPQHLVKKLNNQGVPTERKVSVVESKRRKVDKADHKKKKDKKNKKKKSHKKEDVIEFDFFEIRYKGDKNNYKYESLYLYEVPSYKPYIKCCLGDTTTPANSVKNTKPGSGQDPLLRYFKKICTPELRLEHSTQFIARDYISLTVSSVCWEPLQDTTNPALDPTTNNLQRNTEAWLEFIESTGKTKAGLERRFEICQKARKFLPNSLEILKKTVETATQFMSNTEIGKLWTDLLFHNPNKGDLWLEYLKFKENSFTELNVFSILAAYKKCFSVLFGFHRGTFRSHTFEGDIEIALISVYMKLVTILRRMGYLEKSYSLIIAILELSTSTKTKADFSGWWNGGYELLGNNRYKDWWESTTESSIYENITLVQEFDDIWLEWLRHENLRDCMYPAYHKVSPEAIDTECAVTSPWLNNFLFQSEHPDLLLESVIRSFLPVESRDLNLILLLHSDISLENRVFAFLLQLCERIYPRLKEKTVIGVFWILLHQAFHKNHKSTSKLIKRLLKDASHRNNMVYWYWYIHFTRDASIVDKLSASNLPAYHTDILRKISGRYEDRMSDLQLHIHKPIKSTTETLLLGSHLVTLFCLTYHVTSSPTFYEDFLSQFQQCDISQEQRRTDLFWVSHFVVTTSGGSTNDTIRKACLLAVSEFPQVQVFWDELAKHVTLTGKIWDKLVRGGGRSTWTRRIRAECEKQARLPDVNLVNRITSLCLTALDIFPNWTSLWRLYIKITMKYDKKSLRSVLIRSIKHNPADKEFYLLAIRHCPEERETVYSLIEEKQVRQRTLIEEIMMFRGDD